MFFLNRSVLFSALVFFFCFFTSELRAQDCPVPFAGSFLPSPAAGFSSIPSVEVNKPLIILSNTILTPDTRKTIRFRIGFIGTPDFRASDFNCGGPCKTNPNVIIPSLTSFEIVQFSDLEVVFNVPGTYFIIQTYTDAVSGTGYYSCSKVVVYPTPKSTYRTCGCDLVLVTIPPIAENLFYDEIEIFFTQPTPGGQKILVPKADFGKEITNPIPIPGGCSDRSSFQVTGMTKTVPFITHSEPLTSPILFSSAIKPINFIKELKHEVNDDFVLQFSSDVTDGIEVSYDKGLSWAVLPSNSYSIVVAGREFVLKGLSIPPTGYICFRGFSNCGGTITPEIDRPTVCYTGEIEKISDEIGTSDKREVKITLKSKNTDLNASVLVLGNFGLTTEYGVSSGTNEYFDDKATCGDLIYRTKTNIINSIGGNTLIFSKPVSYKIKGNAGLPFEGGSVVTVKSISYSANGQLADLSFAPSSNVGKSYNFYKSSNSGPFVKLNSTPVNQLFFQDFSTDPLVKNCYYVKAQDQCGYETQPSKTICTTLLKSNGNLIEWTTDNVAVSKSNSFATVIGYKPQTVICSNGTCVGKDFSIVYVGNNFNMDIMDTDPQNVHFVNVRVQVVFSGSEVFDVSSNIIEHYFQPKLFIPNIITPNGDSNNDDLKIDGFHIKNFVMDVYNRWGEKIETLTNINQKWIPANNLPEGEYFYKATAVDYSPAANQITKQGSILLVR